MARLYKKGYITNDRDGVPALTDNSDLLYGISIIEVIEHFAQENGLYGKHHKGLGGRKAYIEDCNLRMYFTNEKCELEDAVMSMDILMYGGDLKTKVDYCGYSEYTITGLDVDEFTIGGHDLKAEFENHYGQYCHLIIEC